MKKERETIKKYTNQWKVATQVQPSFLKREIVTMFIDTLQTPFYDRMIKNVLSKFSNLVIIGEGVKMGVRNGKITQVVVTNTNKPSIAAYKRKRTYDPNAKCEYHANAISYITERCWRLKHKVQELIDGGWLSFKENDPNIGNNPLLDHEGTNIIERMS
ncbi:hypothetical protein CR513_21039, partial [Mucuna pruriens]